MSLVGSFALRQVETIADLQRAFNALFGTEVACKPFRNRYLAVNATRAHPKRDRRTGRLQLGQAPVLGAA